ncbi:hypothetical protein PR202_ga28701 [Eleusine coracana subsp. coracana]|uniref:Trichome birefringence-like C-terminal domain-containing protein n=1 Tax=Eleusine coracana subsp. coracana TaxID=191504 RepID=A0AAV5DJU3_ELECO|nr:hypothetical protein PR202_ga28701 [Eleusine coracana subsp. coracana]
METQPIVNRTTPLDIGTDWRLHGAARGVLARYLNRGKLLTPEQQADPKTYADCIHWCLPGLPDTWNHFIYAHIISRPLTTSS